MERELTELRVMKEDVRESTISQRRSKSNHSTRHQSITDRNSLISEIHTSVLVFIMCFSIILKFILGYVFRLLQCPNVDVNRIVKEKSKRVVCISGITLVFHEETSV